MPQMGGSTKTTQNPSAIGRAPGGPGGGSGIRSPYSANPADKKEADMEPDLDYLERATRMTDPEFAKLKDEIEELLMDLHIKQAAYRRQTGVNYVPPVRA